MEKWKSFECPQCREAFVYDPSPNAIKLIDDTELKSGQSCLVAVDCPHCAAFLSLDREAGRSAKIKPDRLESAEMGGLVYDMTVKERTWDKAGELVAAGHSLMMIDVAQAETRFREAIAISKHHSLAWFNLSVCRQRAGDLVGTAECLQHALLFDRTLIQAWNNLGSLWANAGELEEATRCFDEGLAVDPNYPKFYLGKANIAAMKGDVGTASDLLRLALEKDPAYEPAHAFLRLLEEAAQSRK